MVRAVPAEAKEARILEFRSAVVLAEEEHLAGEVTAMLQVNGLCVEERTTPFKSFSDAQGFFAAMEKMPELLVYIAAKPKPGQAPDWEAARRFFWILKAIALAEPRLRLSLVAVSWLGGTFGLESMNIEAAGQGGVTGAAKAALREWAEARVRLVDLDPALDETRLAAQLWQEISSSGEELEVGFTAKGRFCLALQEEPLPQEVFFLEQDAVVLATGGAYGITALCIEEMAKRSPCRIVLLGRSPLPEEEGAETRMLAEERELKAHFIQKAQEAGEKPQPRAIDDKAQRVLKNREILGTIERLCESGAKVEYRALDVRDEEAFSRCIDELYARYGRIDGVVHGAGVIEDKRIAEKSEEAFCRVFDTKVKSAWVLAQKIRPESLKFLCFFSSVSGRFGNAGQVDYSAANDALNKLADALWRQWQKNVVAINWGPWDFGMVSESLKRLYAQRGIGLIPPEEGAALFLEEISRQRRSCAEVVVSASVETMAEKGLGVAP